MVDDTALQRCLELVALLDAEHEWGLALPDQWRYARAIVKCCINIADMSDAQICTSLRYYHKDHALVAALLDSAHPDHGERWIEWTRLTLRILAAKSAGTRLPDEIVASLEDLAQEAIQDLWRGLPHFSYQSSFQTWAFTVVGHYLARHYRALQTQKRSALPPPQSLDSMLAIGDTLCDDVTPPPDDVAFSNILAHLVNRVLEQHPDQRIPLVFHLWVYEEKPLRVIGDQLNLSPARVHALLKQTTQLLRSELTLQKWAEHDSNREIAA